MWGSVRPRGNYFFQRRAPWRVKSAPSFSNEGQRMRMSLVGRHSVLSSRPGTALTGRASEMAEAAVGPTVAAGKLLDEGVSPEGERALEEQRSRASGSGVGVQVTSSEGLRRKRHSYQEWLAKKRAALVERRRREEEAKRAVALSFDADLMGIVPEVARKRIQERRDQKRRVDTNLCRSQSAADEQHVRLGLGPSPPPNIHYRSNEPPIPGTRQQLWDQRMAVVAAYTRPITLPSELPSEAGGESANAPPKQNPQALAPEAPNQPLALEAPQLKTPKQTCIDRRIDEISERHENPYTQAKQVFDWMPPPAGSARAETRVPFGSRPEGVDPLNLRAESSSSPKSGPSSLSPGAKSSPSASSAHTAAKKTAVTSPKAESSQPTPAHSSQQPQVAASASGLVPHPPTTPPARDTRSTPRRSRQTGAAAAPTVGAGASAGAGAEAKPASRKPSEALKSRPGDWIDALSEFVGAKKEGEPRGDVAAPEAASPAESIITQQEAHSPDVEKRSLQLESNSSADFGLSLSSPKEQQPSPPAPVREALEETNELRGTAEEAISSAAISTVTAAITTVPVEVKETVAGSTSPRTAETGSEAAVAASNSPPEQPSSPPLEHNENPSSPAAASALSSQSQQLKPPTSPPPVAESGEGEDEGEAAEVVEDAPEIEAAAESDEEDLGNKSLFM